MLLPFHYENYAFIAWPQNVFRPEGLAVWAPEDAEVEIQNGMDVDAVVSSGNTPAAFYYAMPKGMGYAELAERIEKGETPPKSWQEFRTLEVGNSIKISVSRFGNVLGPENGVQLVMWGLTVE